MFWSAHCSRDISATQRLELDAISWTCIRDVPGSNSGNDICYPKDFMVFLSP
jgi:hypothetical protein